MAERLAAAHDHDPPALLDDEDPALVAGRRGDVERAVEVADLDQAHAAPAAARPRRARRPRRRWCRPSRWRSCRRLGVESAPHAATQRAASRTSATAGRRIRSGCHGLVTQVAPGLTARHERASFDVIVIGAGPAGEVCARAPGRGRPGGRDRRARSSSAASARSTPACRRRRCCGPAEALDEARRIPGAAEAVDRRARRAGRRSPAATRSSTTSTTTRSCRGSRSAASSSSAATGGSPASAPCRSATRARGPPRGRRRHRHRGALIPPIAGLREAEPWTNREATTDQDVPGRLLVLGGGVVGVEMAAGVRARSARSVTLVEGGPRVLAREEPFAGEQVRDARSRPRRRRSSPAPRRPRCARNGGGHDGARGRHERLAATRSSCAVGRRSLTADLGARDVGLEPGRAGRGRRHDARRTATTGSTRSATPTAASCSPTWASTRAGSPPTTSSARRVELRSDGALVAARDLHRPAGRRRRPHAGQRARGGLDVRARRGRDRRQRRRLASTAAAPRARRGSSSTRTAA